MGRNSNLLNNTKFFLILNTVVLLALFFLTAPLSVWLVVVFIFVIGLEINLLFALLPLRSWGWLLLRVILPIIVVIYLILVYFMQL